MHAELVQYGYALLDDTGKTISIDKVNRVFGHSHQFYCPNCKHEMYATYGEGTQLAHFRHNGAKCEYSNYLHALAEQVFIEEYEQCIHDGLPFNLSYHIPVKCVRECIKERSYCGKKNITRTIDLTQYFTKVSREARVEIGERFRRPDILLESEDGKQLWVEIWVSHQTEEEKRKDGTILELRFHNENEIEEIRKHSLTQSVDKDTSVRIFGEIIPIERPTCEKPVLSTPSQKQYSYRAPRPQPKAPPAYIPTINDSIEEQHWVDLGLPSGTLWAEEDAGKMGYYTASRKYGDSLPTRAQAEELRDNCSRDWNKEERRLILTGPSGNSISFFCRDKHEGWWCQGIVGYDNRSSFAACFNVEPPLGFYINDRDTDDSTSVRLVKQP